MSNHNPIPDNHPYKDLIRAFDDVFDWLEQDCNNLEYGTDMAEVVTTLKTLQRYRMILEQTND